MALLMVAAMIWTGCHIGVAGTTARRRLVGRFGDNGFRAGFSVISVAAISLLVVAYRQAPFAPVWTAPDWLRWVLAAAMLPAFLLFAAALPARNPTAIGGEGALREEPRGIVRITRHPMLCSFALWAAVHVLGNGDAASLLFFGSFLVTAMAGMPSIDAKVAARDPDGWRRFASVTSILPFGAIVARRNRLVVAEMGPLPFALGVVLWVALLWAHPWIFGVNPVPG